MRRLRAAVTLLLVALLAVASGPARGPAAAAGPPLRFLAGPVGTLDPAFIADAADVQFLLQVYAGLTRLDETGEPYASLAESWQTSADGMTYTFTLRDDLVFSDGTPLEAGDVRRSWLRLLDPATGASAPEVLSVIDGATARLAGEIEEDEVGIEATDATTLIVRLRHPAAYFPEVTATPATFVVPPQANGGPDWQSVDAFVGSGPYVVERLDGADLVLRANQRYVAGPPPIDELRWLADLEGGGAGAFAAGEVDLVQVPAFDATWIAYDPDLGRHLHQAEALTISYYGFDTTRPPFDDARVRRAFALVLDRERLVPLAEGSASQPATSIVPPAIWPDGFGTPTAPDPDEARRLLDEAGYADRDDIGVIVVNGSALGVDPAVATWREELGVEIVIEQMDGGTYFEELGVRTPQVFTVIWIADYPSPHAIYSLLLDPAALSNFGGWNDARFVELLEAAASAPDEVATARAYRAVDAHVAEQAPLLPWAYDHTWWLVGDGLRGLGNLTIGLIDFGRVSWDG